MHIDSSPLKKMIALVLSLSATVAGLEAKAAIIAETFSGYSDNVLISGSPAGPATGLVGNWTLVPNSDFYVNRSQLDLDSGTGQAVYDRPSSDNGVRVATRATSANHSLFENDGDRFYASFLVDPARSTGDMTFELDLTRSDGGGALDLSFGIINGQFIVGNGGVDVDVSGGVVSADEQLIVIGVEYGDSTFGLDDNEVISLWVNPTSESSTPVVDGQLADVLSRGGGRISAISIRGDQMFGGPSFYDNLWVGTSFPVAVPEPGAMPFISMCVIAIGLVRRRRH